MSPHTVALVQNSWAKVTPIAPQAAELFYNNLFARDPALIPLFRGDIRVQGQKLMTMIGAAVSKLGAIDTLVPVLQDLGRRHGGYGVQPHHYDTVGSALLQCLQQRRTHSVIVVRLYTITTVAPTQTLQHGNERVNGAELIDGRTYHGHQFLALYPHIAAKQRDERGVARKQVGIEQLRCLRRNWSDLGPAVLNQCNGVG